MAADNISIFFPIKFDQEYFNFIEGHQITKNINLKAKIWKSSIELQTSQLVVSKINHKQKLERIESKDPILQFTHFNEKLWFLNKWSFSLK